MAPPFPTATTCQTRGRSAHRRMAPAAATNSTGHPRAVQREQQRRRRHIGHPLDTRHHQGDLVPPGHRQHHLGGERQRGHGECPARADQSARIRDADHHGNQPDDQEVGRARKGRADDDPNPVDRGRGGEQRRDDERNRSPRTQPRQHGYEREHHQIHPEEPQERYAFDPERGRGIRPERHPHQQESDSPRREVPEHGPAQPLGPGEQPRAPRGAIAPAVRARGAAREEEQRHDLHGPGDRRDRRQRTQQVADAQAARVDGGEQECAVPEHHDHEGGEPGDVDGAVALGHGRVW